MDARSMRWLVAMAVITGLGCETSAEPGTGTQLAGSGGSAPIAGAAPWPAAGSMALPSAGQAGAAGAGVGVAGAIAAGSGGVGGAVVSAGSGGAAGAVEAGTGASGSGGAAGSGVDGGVPTEFAPCPEDEPCKILPVGDSITAGVGAPGGGGYREPLFGLALAAGQSITYVGSQAGGPTMVDGVTFPRAHEGHSGRTISFIAGRIPDPALTDGPHIVLLMIGTNDMYMQPTGAPERLADLLDDILEAAPEALLVVAQLTPFPSADAQVQAYNAEIPPLVEERAATGEHILLVDMYTDFPEELIGDGVHPDADGYALMAERWYEAIAEYLPAAP
jgi:lysophospholipase L1-like esterase